eukprot:CAMPEP_0115545042 /NCGR_PEP_ID=MMETSP0271-20121206/92403_1 /TAXON_ID=71861 /ORGANISM="Scrippsiella trochoidea, Strain CCMP3099" /LENGTH=101 /DNA_ID=CAMNT_0002978383 /DNA_START=239 /DNA_END=544 /DNA_ORIENTATION=-
MAEVRAGQLIDVELVLPHVHPAGRPGRLHLAECRNALEVHLVVVVFGIPEQDTFGKQAISDAVVVALAVRAGTTMAANALSAVALSAAIRPHGPETQVPPV